MVSSVQVEMVVQVRKTEVKICNIAMKNVGMRQGMKITQVCVKIRIEICFRHFDEHLACAMCVKVENTDLNQRNHPTHEHNNNAIIHMCS